MSNEFKEWLEDRITEVVLDSGAMDRIEEISNPSFNKTDVHGWKNGQKVLLKVWFDDELEGWKIERMELNK